MIASAVMSQPVGQVIGGPESLGNCASSIFDILSMKRDGHNGLQDISDSKITLSAKDSSNLWKELQLISDLIHRSESYLKKIKKDYLPTLLNNFLYKAAEKRIKPDLERLLNFQVLDNSDFKQELESCRQKVESLEITGAHPWLAKERKAIVDQPTCEEVMGKCFQGLLHLGRQSELADIVIDALESIYTVENLSCREVGDDVWIALEKMSAIFCELGGPFKTCHNILGTSPSLRTKVWLCSRLFRRDQSFLREYIKRLDIFTDILRRSEQIFTSRLSCLRKYGEIPKSPFGLKEKKPKSSLSTMQDSKVTEYWLLDATL